MQRDSRCKIVVSSTAIVATLISSQILIESHNRQSRIQGERNRLQTIHSVIKDLFQAGNC